MTFRNLSGRLSRPFISRAVAASPVVIGVVAMVLCGCGSQLSSVDRLDQTLSYFHTHLLQAGEVQRAAAYVDRDFMEDFLNMHDPELNAYTLVEFSVVSVKYHRDENGRADAATAVIKAAVIGRNSITVENRQVREKWELRGTRWTMVSEEILANNRMGTNEDVGQNAIDGDDIEPLDPGMGN